jgi:hypothetical protein
VVLASEPYRRLSYTWHTTTPEWRSQGWPYIISTSRRCSRPGTCCRRQHRHRRSRPPHPPEAARPASAPARWSQSRIPRPGHRQQPGEFIRPN